MNHFELGMSFYGVGWVTPSRRVWVGFLLHPYPPKSHGAIGDVTAPMANPKCFGKVRFVLSLFGAAQDGL